MNMFMNGAYTLIGGWTALPTGDDVDETDRPSMYGSPIIPVFNSVSSLSGMGNKMMHGALAYVGGTLYVNVPSTMSPSTTNGWRVVS